MENLHIVSIYNPYDTQSHKLLVNGLDSLKAVICHYDTNQTLHLRNRRTIYISDKPYLSPRSL
jgi:hypothetical protein